MSKPERQIEHLNALGRVVWFSGAAARFTAEAVDHLIDRSAEVLAEAEHAFKQGLDPNVEEAKILEEHDRDNLDR